MFPLPILSHRRFDFRPYPSYLFQDATTRSLEKPLKHHAGAAPAPLVWKTRILAVIRMVHGGKRYFTFYTAPLPVPAVNLSWSLVDYSPHSQDSGIPACFLFKSLRHTYMVSSHISNCRSRNRTYNTFFQIEVLYPVELSGK